MIIGKKINVEYLHNSLIAKSEIIIYTSPQFGNNLRIYLLFR